MATSIVDKYEQILAADPRSRIFVELARTLVDRGEHARAIEVCVRGLEHHPSSILGRVTWGRALLESGDTKGALDQFELAMALDPTSPYAYNQVGEALLAKELHREALPVLARAAELQPADIRVRDWLEEAKRRSTGEGARPSSAPGDAAAATDSDRTAPSPPSPARSIPTLTPASGLKAAANGTANAAENADAPSADETSTATEKPNGSAAPPPLPPGPPPPLPGGEVKRSVLYMLPGESNRDVIGPSLASRLDLPAAAAPALAAPADPAEAQRAAAEYERQLREKLLAAPEPPPSFVHRHRRLVAGGIVALALAAAGGVYAVVTARNAALEVAGAASRARAGLARDTLASLREAHRLLGEALKRSPDPEVVSLGAQVAALLAAEHGDERLGEVALALADQAAGSDGELAARYLLAANPAERAEAEAAVLAARPSSGPLVQALAGRILVARGEVEGGRGRLEIAARANPPLLRALADLGDVALSAGDPEGALAYYAAAIAAHPTHPRSVIGSAEARLALGHELELSRQQLAAVERDEGSRPPLDLNLRFAVAAARVEAALGEATAAAARLTRAGESGGESPALAAALAELHLQSRAWEKAEAAAARAVAREPRQPEHRVLLARARIGRGRPLEALSATDGVDGRAVRLQRAIARYRLGQWPEARAELERTARDGKLAGEAAVWYALVEVASGRAKRALPLVDKLSAAKAPPPLAHFARGRALEALGRRSEAVAAFRLAAEREPRAPEGHLALGRIFLRDGRAREALAPLERAVKLDPADAASRRLLGEARLAAGQPSAARADLDLVLLSAPRDAGALRLLSAAWLAEGQAEEARRAAERAVSAAPKDPIALLAAARATLATGDAQGARKLAERAVKAGASGPEREEAKRIAAGHLPRKR